MNQGLRLSYVHEKLFKKLNFFLIIDRPDPDKTVSVLTINQQNIKVERLTETSYLSLPSPTLSTFLAWSHILTNPYFSPSPGVFVMAFYVSKHHVPWAQRSDVSGSPALDYRQVSATTITATATFDEPLICAKFF